jgi:hypothetical protein
VSTILPAPLAAALAQFDVWGDVEGVIRVRHRTCRADLGAAKDELAPLVAAAVQHLIDCPGPVPREPLNRRPCGAVHAGSCEVLNRERTENGEWVTFRHDDGTGTVFNGETL